MDYFNYILTYIWSTAKTIKIWLLWLKMWLLWIQANWVFYAIILYIIIAPIVYLFRWFRKYWFNYPYIPWNDIVSFFWVLLAGINKYIFPIVDILILVILIPWLFMLWLSNCISLFFKTYINWLLLPTILSCILCLVFWFFF